MRSGFLALIIGVAAVGCVAPESADTAVEGQGMARVHVDASLLPGNVTRMTVEGAGQTVELELDPTNTFRATLILPSGTQTLVGRAFVGDQLVGQSKPTQVEVVNGVVTQVFLSVLDVTEDHTPVFGPIFDSLSFPESISTDSAATLAISVAAPGGDPVSYQWTTDCPDSTFTASNAATTGWSKPSQGVCAFSVTAASNGFTVSREFSIIVFPAAGAGAVDASAGFVFGPEVGLDINGAGCGSTSSPDSSCHGAVASPDLVSYSTSVFNYLPGTFQISDDCGGTFFPTFKSQTFELGFWQPPVDAGVCILTARAVSATGAVGRRSFAILVHAGTP